MKSHASDLLKLAACIYKDACAKCTANDPDERDLRTIKSRVEAEGLSFLTLTLPALGADFEKSLRTEYIDSTLFRGFRKRGKAPAFLQGFFSQIFDLGTGRILNEPAMEAIEGLRQIAYAFKKIQLECSPNRVRKALEKFTECELDLKEPLAPDDLSLYTEVSRCIWSTVFLSDGSTNPLASVPKHGPGATAERIHGNKKYTIGRWHERLEPYFPYYHFAFSSENARGSTEDEGVSLVDGADEQPVRVITVPKTLKGPRIIAIEPVCMQYTQQALARVIVDTLERSKQTKRHINFECQSVNRELAMVNSKTRRLATLDLSSASDRVPLSLAMQMFDSFPDLQGAIFACRSRRALLPSGDIVTLRKFASMGSALCFPIEAMYFYTICIAARLRIHNLPVTPQNIFKMGRDVYVYGDDILVPTNEAETVADYLQKYYCKVNMSKSYWTGRFRESCGMDAFDGEEVTPTYIRRLPPGSRRNSPELISWVETSNLFYRKGYWKTAAHMVETCEHHLGKLPVVGENSAALGKVSFQPYVSTGKWRRRYQSFEVKAWVARPVYRHDRLDGYHALAKCLIKRPGPPDPDVDTRHLVRTARHGAVTLQRRWTRPY